MRSSLGGNNVDHATTGSHGRKAIPRAEGHPIDDTYRPTQWPVPEEIREWKFNSIRKIHLGALSPGDYFTTSLTHRRGWVLAQARIDVSEPAKTRFMRGMRWQTEEENAPREIRPVTRVEWGGFEDNPGEPVNLSASILVVSGWWEVKP